MILEAAWALVSFAVAFGLMLVVGNALERQCGHFMQRHQWAAVLCVIALLFGFGRLAFAMFDAVFPPH